MENLTEISGEYLIQYGPKIVFAIIVLLVGFYVIKWINTLLRKMLEKREVDPTLRPFLANLVGAFLKIALIISVISMVGVETTSFVAVLGAMGLAVGLALQGSLSNFAGGVLIILFKPFEVGHWIEAQGQMGSVKEISILYTVLKTGDAKIIVIPNSAIMGGSITNFTKEPIRRVDMKFGISYSDDIDKAKNVLRELMEEDERIHKDPEPFIVVSELGESSVNLTVRVWCDAGNFWPLFFHMQETVKKTFDKKGISIPFPQRDVHLFQKNK